MVHWPRVNTRAAAALCLVASALFSVGFIWTGGGSLAVGPPGAEAPLAPLVRRPRSPRRFFSPPAFRQISVLGKRMCDEVCSNLQPARTEWGGVEKWAGFDLSQGMGS